MDPALLQPLFTPLAIKGLTLPNRFVMPAMQRGWCTGGVPSPDIGKAYAERVRGGVGLVTSEALAIDHASATGQTGAARFAPDTREAWAATIGAVKNAGGAMFMQLFHEGAMSPGPAEQTLSPSGLAWAGRVNGRAATLAELDSIRDAFVRSALMAQDLGADEVELHGAHGFLIDQFLWHETNARADGLGGSDLALRLEWPLQVVRAVRAAVGPDFVIGLRLSQWKEVDYTARLFETPDQLGQALTAFGDAGIDLFHMSTRRFYQPEWPELSDLGLAGWATKLSGKPVTTVGSIGVRDLLFAHGAEDKSALDPLASIGELARRFANGEFALAAVGRALLADPDWVNKLRDGRLDAITAFDSNTLEFDATQWDLSLAMEGVSRFEH